ncbi:MAG: hypothetical protein HN909_00695 [Phycisphaerales bacterium]|jgi:hypothetical protein|nr:hypothetical protein [Phycisphaerales bacterium]MBT7170267.1 hypothetical protein [Phycisphaerales bacterium]
MRWLALLVVGWAIVLVQSTFGRVLVLEDFVAGPIGPDMMIALLVLLGLNGKKTGEVCSGAMVLGLMVDLTTAGGVDGLTRVGPMMLAYGLGMYVIQMMREAVYRDSLFPVAILSGLVALVTHTTWIILQHLFADGGSFSAVLGSLAQVICSAVYTAVIVPWVYWILRGATTWILPSQPTERRRSRRG